MRLFNASLRLLVVLFALGCTADEAPTRPVCPEGQARCAGRCVSLSDDAENCGACGSVCVASPHASPLCIDGSCQLSCRAGYTDCNVDPSDGCETDLTRDMAHCGACGQPCAPDHAQASCVAGRCVMGACLPGFADCDRNAANGCETDLANDPNHCGRCDTRCAPVNAMAACSAGQCGLGSCLPGFGNCDGNPDNGCETLLNTELNCGACGERCGDRGCVAQRCVECQGSQRNCSPITTGCETNVATDRNHCGACGNACPTAVACVAGACAGCDEGYADCNANRADGCETLVLGDVANCGACGNACTPGMSCSVGRCVGCPTGMGDCNFDPADGCETRLDTTDNCGACRTVCNAGQHGTATCAGACVTGCEAGFANCNDDHYNGCEVDLRSDRTNCGACGNACPVGERCEAGVCAPGRIRLIGPLSGSRVTSTHPRLRWELPVGVGAARLEVCRDRACATVIESREVTGAETAVTTELAAGVVFWRLRPLMSGALRDSPVWEFFVPWRSAPNGFAHGIVPDFNGDGRSDLAVTDLGSGETRVFLATPTGLVRALTIARPSDGLERFGGHTSSVGYATVGTIAAGDVNGDGFVDLLVTYSRSAPTDGLRESIRLNLHRGSPLGPLPEPQTIMQPGYSPQPSRPLGDFNQDGYADLLVSSGYSVEAHTPLFVLLPGTEGSPNNHRPSAGWEFQTPDWAGDLDGDGSSDLMLTGNASATYVQLGSAGIPREIVPATDRRTTPYRNCYGLPSAAGDLDGDGLDDLMVRTACGTDFLLRGHTDWRGELVHESPPTSITVTPVGDLDADGFGEVFDTLTGAPGTIAWLWHRNAGSDPWTRFATPPSAIPLGGVRYIGAGDMTGDGIDDLLVYSFESAGGHTAQRIDLYAGGRSGLGTTPWSTIEWPDARGPLSITRLR